MEKKTETAPRRSTAPRRASAASNASRTPGRRPSSQTGQRPSAPRAASRPQTAAGAQRSASRSQAASGADRKAAPAHRIEYEEFMPRADRASFSSRVNSARLTYLRKVPLFYRRVIALAVPLLLILVIVLCVVHAVNRHRDDTALRANAPYRPEAVLATATPTADVAALVENVWGADSQAAETETYASEAETTAQDELFAPDAIVDIAAATPTPAPTTATASGGTQTWQDGAYAPEPEGPGYLPVFSKAERTDKVIAITVDDCYQTNNLRDIIDAAAAVNGKLTIFPIGVLMQRESLQEQLRRAHELGFEIENHTWSHAGLYHNTDEELAQEVFDQDRAVDLVLGVNYQSHFLRPRGGDDRNDIRTHAYASQLGYYGIAHWSATGTLSTLEKVKENLAPGVVYLFHCIDSDLAILKEFIPYAVSQGYQLLTLNELFGYEQNVEEPLTDDPMTRTIVPLGDYERDYKTIKNPTYSYAAYEVQVKLKELGFLDSDPDGIYGKGTAAAAKKWQESKGLPGDGVLTPDQQHLLLD